MTQNRAPLAPDEARQAGMALACGDEDELERLLSGAFGRQTPIADPGRLLQRATQQLILANPRQLIRRGTLGDAEFIPELALIFAKASSKALFAHRVDRKPAVCELNYLEATIPPAALNNNPEIFHTFEDGVLHCNQRSYRNAIALCTARHCFDLLFEQDLSDEQREAILVFRRQGNTNLFSLPQTEFRQAAQKLEVLIRTYSEAGRHAAQRIRSLRGIGLDKEKARPLLLLASSLCEAHEIAIDGCATATSAASQTRAL